MIISIIAALTRNNIIGNKNTIPWYLPADIAWFKFFTLNKPIIMGRLTWESINCTPLPNRINIIISNKYFKSTNKILWVNSIEKAIQAAGKVEEIMVIGGSTIYSQFLNIAKRMYLTKINIQIEGNIYFPKYNKSEWKLIFQKKNKLDKKNFCNYYFEIFEKI